MIAPSRRSFITALVGAVAAPMVIRSGLLMPVRAIVRPGDQALTVTINGIRYTLICVLPDIRASVFRDEFGLNATITNEYLSSIRCAA